MKINLKYACVPLLLSETAINIGYSCQLLTDEMEEVFIIDAEEKEEVEKQLNDALNHIRDVKKGEKDHTDAEVHFANGTTSDTTASGSFTRAEEIVSLEGENETFALVISGHSLVRLKFITLYYSDFFFSSFLWSTFQAHTFLFVYSWYFAFKFSVT